MPKPFVISKREQTRRDFLKISAASTLAMAFSECFAMAGTRPNKDLESLIPADKRLSPEWIKSLFERGEPAILRGEELKYVGMPIGGIGAGQLYIGGDGQLWHWDIFNQFIFTDATHYAHPMIPESPLRQKFSLKIGGKTFTLDRDGFSGITFSGQYPIATVEYTDSVVPLTVRLEAFSPFIPLNTDDSSLPATIFQFTIRNPSAATVTAEIVGELENGVCLHHRAREGNLVNRTVKTPAATILHLSAQAAAETAIATSEKPVEPLPLEKLPDFGTIALVLLGEADQSTGDCQAPFSDRLIGSLGQNVTLAPGESKTVTFAITWHFPNLSIHNAFSNCGRYYSTKFASAQAVANYVIGEFARLDRETKMWRDTWYDSTLPHWFLDRTFLNTSILATSTCYRLENGRFYGWEGVGNCAGTCGHVYLYAQAIARLFPDLERDVRERVDFGLAQRPDGAIHFRGEFNKIPAIDAQSGYVLRAFREHQMSADDQFLRRIWPQVKLAMEWLMEKDGNGDGLIEGAQHNTLDTDWYGKVAWLSGLYVAALEAAAQMAEEIGDAAFAAQCRRIFEAGQKNLVRELFDSGYFINKVDSRHLDAINSGTGCEIDQVFGQSWAFQTGIPRVFPRKQTVSALKLLWKYNFTPDVGPYRQHYKPGRWYAMPGEAGLLMCTFPHADWDYAQAKGKGPEWAAGYFNECMNGFEHQVAGHLIWEGLLLEGFAIERAVHDRYSAKRRNPWNEIECGDHYARSMSSYGVYLAACGFEYHGPNQHIGFAPRLTPENFKCAFTGAEGWGSFSQKLEKGKLKAEISVGWGQLRLKSIGLESHSARQAQILMGNKHIQSTFTRNGERITLVLESPIVIPNGEQLDVILS